MAARSISCKAWPAATRTFFGVQPRFGHVPPRMSASIMATDMPARRTGPVTPIPALPPPRITTSNLLNLIEQTSSLAACGRTAADRPRRPRDLGALRPGSLTWRGAALLLAGDRRSDGADNHGCHLVLRVAIPDLVAPRDPVEIGPDRPDVAIVILRQ